MKHRRTLALAMALTLSLTGCGALKDEDVTLSSPGGTVKSEEAQPVDWPGGSDVTFKWENGENNPLITNIFCADPTAVEYNGRLYVYGTNDDQQYQNKPNSDNTYEQIKSFVIISTEDMVNWRYEGIIDTEAVAPWVFASWAPSIVSREESDGKTHFYLYFSNSGAGVGVLTSTSPTGPWSDPLGEPLISSGMPGLEGCPNPFDPGACIDDNGTGWLAFGGGRASDGTDYMPGSARIVKLGEDMLSFDSDFVEVKTPYFFEASELNYFNGTWLYTFNTSWDKRLDWDSTSIVSAPPACSMAYMRSTDPLNTDSWEYVNYYLKNPGELGMEYSNNHTHLQKFGDKYYLFYHTLILQRERGITKGFRSLGVDLAQVDEEHAFIEPCEASPFGPDQIKKLDPYTAREAEENWFTDCQYLQEEGITFARCGSENIIGFKGVRFSDGSRGFAAKVRGTGTLEVRLDKPKGDKLCAVKSDPADWTTYYTEAEAEGTHDLFFVFDGELDLDQWQFIE